MRNSQLRRILQGVVVAGLPAFANGCFLHGDDSDDNCTETSTETFLETLPVTDTDLQAKIDRCRADRDKCFPVCNSELELHDGYGTASACQVTFEGTQMTVKAGVSIGCDVGRRPAGLVPMSPGSYLAQAGWLEAASVHAFARLARELARFDAPDELVRACRAALDDELRHTSAMARLAARTGDVIPPVVVDAVPERTLEAIAIENAVEGCVRETWGATVALWQSNTARDPEVRATLAVIAEDEVRHAALAWSIHDWVMPRLDELARRRVEAALEAAARALRVEQAAGPTMSIALAAELGLPMGGDAIGLADRSHAALWASHAA